MYKSLVHICLGLWYIFGISFLVRMNCASLPLLIKFHLKAIFPDIGIVISAYFLVTFSICSSTLMRYLSLKVRWSLSTQHEDEFCFLIHSVTLYLFSGQLKLLILKVIIKRSIFIATFYICVLWSYAYSFRFKILLPVISVGLVW